MGKLGATAPEATAVAVNSAALGAGGGVVNGPEDLPDWEAIDWGHHEEQVQRLRQRIFKAAQAGDRKQVRNLQKLMLRSARAKRCRCGGCTYRRKAGNARSGFLLSRIAPSSSGCVTRWSRSGNTASYTPTAPAATRQAATGTDQHKQTPAHPRGLLEPCATTSGPHGGGCRKTAPPIRRFEPTKLARRFERPLLSYCL
jgi:hypothetical protein